MNTLEDFRKGKLLEKSFKFLKKNRIFYKKLKNLIRKRIWKMQTMYFQGLKEVMKIKIQKNETIRSLQEFYYKNLMSKCFKNWNIGCARADMNVHYYNL